jgi:hypothetical protein
MPEVPKAAYGFAGLLTPDIRSPRQNHQDQDSPAARINGGLYSGPDLLCSQGPCLPNSPRLLDAVIFHRDAIRSVRLWSSFMRVCAVSGTSCLQGVERSEQKT